MTEQAYPERASGGASRGDGGGGGDGLFGRFDGFPAHTMVVLGVVLALLAPLLPECASARARSAEAELESSRKLIELEMEEFTAQQKEEEEAEKEEAEIPDYQADMKEKEEARKKHREELEDKYGVMGKRRAAVEARASAAGMSAHLFVHWIGRALLVLGLLIMTLSATGTRQKILVAVLLLVLFGSLTGISLDVSAAGKVGS